jgi:hypothetical protein
VRQAGAVLEEPLGSKPSASVWRGYALGLGVDSEVAVPSIQVHLSLDADRTSTWREVSTSEVAGTWALEESVVLFERRAADRRLFLRIEACGGRGYRVWAPYHGRHLVSGDGRWIASAPPRVPPVRWQRHFFGDVLPLAAGLQGVFAFRASAVAVDDRVFVVCGPPGCGKTAVIAHLVALGARFVSDDVTALDRLGATVVAFPGPARLGVKDAEIQRIPSTQASRIGRCLGRSDTLIFEPSPVTRSLPVASVYFLQPEPRLERIVVEPSPVPAGRALLEVDVLSYLATHGERTRAFCDHLDGAADSFAVVTPRGARARDLAARLLAHFR